MKITTDILVVGGGPAGVAAAIAARRKGSSVLLVEKYGFLGGTSTAGMYGTLCGFYTSGPKQIQIIKGIGGEIIEALRAKNAVIGPAISKGMSVLMYDLPTLKLIFDQFILSEGVEVLLHACAVDVSCSKNEIGSVSVSTKSGIIEIEAGLIIDATGDADIAAMANVPYDKNESLLQPGSMMFKMSNVEISEAIPFIRSGQLFRLIQEVDQQGEYRLPRIDGSIIPQPREGQVIVGFSRVLVDGTDVRSLTMAEFEGRSQVKECARFLIERVPGFRHAFISEIPTQLGIRETRKIHGEYCLTKEDVLTGAKFEDSIGRCAWPIEQHIPGAKVTRLEFLDGDDYYNLPFRSLIPHGIGNLLVAGRCSSATGEAQASSRVFAPCTAQGQACGVGAFLSLKDGKPPEKVNIEELHSELEKQGVLI